MSIMPRFLEAGNEMLRAKSHPLVEALAHLDDKYVRLDLPLTHPQRRRLLEAYGIRMPFDDFKADVNRFMADFRKKIKLRWDKTQYGSVLEQNNILEVKLRNASYRGRTLHGEVRFLEGLVPAEALGPDKREALLAEVERIKHGGRSAQDIAVEAWRAIQGLRASLDAAAGAGPSGPSLSSPAAAVPSLSSSPALPQGAGSADGMTGACFQLLLKGALAEARASLADATDAQYTEDGTLIRGARPVPTTPFRPPKGAFPVAGDMHGLLVLGYDAPLTLEAAEAALAAACSSVFSFLSADVEDGFPETAIVGEWAFHILDLPPEHLLVRAVAYNQSIYCRGLEVLGWFLRQHGAANQRNGALEAAAAEGRPGTALLAGASNQRILKTLLYLGRMAGQSLEHLALAMLTAEGHNEAAETLDMVERRLRFQATFKPTKEWGKLAQHVIEVCARHGYRLMGDAVFQQIMSPPQGERGIRFPTRAWEYVCGLEELIVAVCPKDTQADILVSCISSHDRVLKYLQTTLDGELPRLVPNQRYFAFRNCVYDTERLRAYVYEQPDFPLNIVACNYIDSVLPWEDAAEEVLEEVVVGASPHDVAQSLGHHSVAVGDASMEDAEDTLRQAPQGRQEPEAPQVPQATPTVVGVRWATSQEEAAAVAAGTPSATGRYKVEQRRATVLRRGLKHTKWWDIDLGPVEDILRFQVRSDAAFQSGQGAAGQGGGGGGGGAAAAAAEEQRILDATAALLGRCFYPLGKYDAWHITLLFLGYAGTGKSTVADFLLSYYPEEARGIFSNNCETKFGLEPLLGKLIWACLEVKADFRLPKTQFLSMSCGENVTVQRKNKTDVTLVWRKPGIMVGNEPPGWKDEGGNLLRRIVMWPFNRYVPKDQVNTNLRHEMERFRGAALVKWTKAYRDFAAVYGARSPWGYVRITVPDASQPSGTRMERRYMLPRMFHDARKTYHEYSHPLPKALSHDGYFYTVGLPLDDPQRQAIIDAKNVRMPFATLREYIGRVWDAENRRREVENMNFSWNSPECYSEAFENAGLTVKKLRHGVFAGVAKSNEWWVEGITLRELVSDELRRELAALVTAAVQQAEEEEAAAAAAGAVAAATGGTSSGAARSIALDAAGAAAPAGEEEADDEEDERDALAASAAVSAGKRQRTKTGAAAHASAAMLHVSRHHHHAWLMSEHGAAAPPPPREPSGGMAAPPRPLAEGLEEPELEGMGMTMASSGSLEDEDASSDSELSTTSSSITVPRAVMRVRPSGRRPPRVMPPARHAQDVDMEHGAWQEDLATLDVAMQEEEEEAMEEG